jgi:hypothetical protein
MRSRGVTKLVPVLRDVEFERGDDPTVARLLFRPGSCVLFRHSTHRLGLQFSLLILVPY